MIITKELNSLVEALKTQIANVKSTENTNISSLKFLDFPGETGTAANTWIKNIATAIKICGFR